ncbi:bifunctional nicotinamidase/pyrazinamidase [Devosia sp.]|uniref:bifunctional nicotinamidase/pyrazinamidase n=1 Tax=Devosia sp. TaxID=1871048 RepID=UPI003A9519D5
MAITPRPDDLLLVVDVQYDFLPGGNLAVADGDAVIPLINGLGRKFTNVVMTQDWHPAGHISFASSHPGHAPFDLIDLPYGPQVLWPDHCVQGTHGGEFAEELDLPHAQLIIRKGYNPSVDSYSGFQEADRTTKTGLAGYLRERGLGRVFVVGLATDFCVAWTALDAVAAGFETFIIEDATRAIDSNGSLDKAWADLGAAGVTRITTGEIA